MSDADTTEPVDPEAAEADAPEAAEAAEPADAPEAAEAPEPAGAPVASDSPAPTAEAVLMHLCRSVVSNPDDVSIEATANGDRVRLDVTVKQDDMGRVIGRRGRVASAIRTVVGAAAAKDGVTTEVEFVE